MIKVVLSLFILVILGINNTKIRLDLVNILILIIMTTREEDYISLGMKRQDIINTLLRGFLTIIYGEFVRKRYKKIFLRNIITC